MASGLENTTSYIAEGTYLSMPLNIPGLVVVLIFYALIFGVGIYASCKAKSWDTRNAKAVMLAGRNVGLLVGFLTTTATWVGGAFINGAAEAIFNPSKGLIWCQAPFGYSISLIIGGLFFAYPMREAEYTTLLDPFERKFGKVMAGFLYIPALAGEVVWSGAVLSALGSTLSVILGLDPFTSVLLSAGVAIVYTMVGGLYSVAYTDVIQLLCVFVGLWLGVVFGVQDPNVGKIFEGATDPETGWIGTIDMDAGTICRYFDSCLLLIFGGLPWQAYFQRVLSAKSPKRARILSFLAGFGCIFMAVPCVAIGAIAHSTDWNATDYALYGEVPIAKDKYKQILPMVLRYLCPLPVMLVGLGAVSAAVMSSADSSLLSIATMFANNIYGPLRKHFSKKEVPQYEIIWSMRIMVLVAGCAACSIALTVKSVYGLLHICSDLCYVILFPQLCCVLYYDRVNLAGSAASYVVGMVLRLTGGEHVLHYPALIKYPFFDYELDRQQFPFKTMSMLISLATLIGVSLIYEKLQSRKPIDSPKVAYISAKQSKVV